MAGTIRMKPRNVMNGATTVRVELNTSSLKVGETDKETYTDYKKEMTAEAGGYNGISPAITGSDVYSRTNKVFGVGVDYKFW